MDAGPDLTNIEWLRLGWLTTRYWTAPEPCASVKAPLRIVRIGTSGARQIASFLAGEVAAGRPAAAAGQKC
jgi:hypothetical protein